MQKLSQTQIVLNQLTKKGQVNNFWAIQHYILRLGARVHELKKRGLKIKGASGLSLQTPKYDKKNYYYFLLND